ncbi:SDR family NAD(P)-dependent oxidoreductase [Actinokineospora sp. NBRC 105648]|uniref:SDR family NAD(P)-dependent oxidoreductase n=1 Tax=Actinokineospora sp. NBRC 105648 TaxID=3032206 RepID=UPI0024A0175B|nr:SDR family NAD(P)-dependent oxidoreductase [Actinokineospora sp. NBRC 105648]GLZ42025.1 beta-ketoacyl-ACP reductase [Actinokineospora sp. NBRC 105648]
MDFGLSDRAVLVTGGSSNIGAATAVAFGREGARVALTYKNNRDAADKVAARVEQAGGQAFVTPFDLEDPAAPEALVRTVVEHWGGLDVLVNNAVRWADHSPTEGPARFETSDRPAWEALVEANLTGYLRVLYAALPALRTSGSGRVVNLSTSLVERGMVGSVAYTAAKSGIHGASRSLAWEVGGDGILVNVVLPGWVIDGKDLPFEIPQALMDEQTGRLPTGRLPLSTHVADTVVFLASQANQSITGEIVHVTGGVS